MPRGALQSSWSLLERSNMYEKPLETHSPMHTHISHLSSIFLTYVKRYSNSLVFDVIKALSLAGIALGSSQTYHTDNLCHGLRAPSCGKFVSWSKYNDHEQISVWLVESGFDKHRIWEALRFCGISTSEAPSRCACYGRFVGRN